MKESNYSQFNEEFLNTYLWILCINTLVYKLAKETGEDPEVILHDTMVFVYTNKYLWQEMINNFDKLLMLAEERVLREEYEIKMRKRYKKRK